jgi:hypothetical protein
VSFQQSLDIHDRDLLLVCQVAILVGDEAVFAIGKPNVKIFEVPIEDGQSNVRDHFKDMSNTDNKPVLAQASNIFMHQKQYCDIFLNNKHMMNELKDADVVIGDGLYPCSSLVADKFDIPHVVVAMSPLATPTYKLFGISPNPSYLPQIMSELTPNMGLLDKIKNLGFFFVGTFAMEYFLYPTYSELKLKHNITPQKNIKQTMANIDFVLMERDFIMDFAQPIPPSR